MNLPHHLWLVGPIVIAVVLIIVFRPMAYQRPPQDSWLAKLSPEQSRKHYWRGIVLAAALIAFVLLVYVVSFVKGPGLGDQGF